MHYSTFPFLRRVLGVLLLAAATLKAHELFTGSAFGAAAFGSRSFAILLFNGELFLGLWLLTGGFPRAAWLAALLCFAAFATVSLAKAVSGAHSCGCFGGLSVSPWWTLSVDIAVLAALLQWQPDAQSDRPATSGRSRDGLQFAAATLVGLLIGVPSSIAIARSEPARLTGQGAFSGDADFVLLEPETWIGQRFPLLVHVDAGDQLSEGEWAVLLFQAGCPKCHEEIAAIDAQATSLAGRSDVRLALVELPSDGPSIDLPAALPPDCLVGRLSEHKRWFAQTPVWIHLADGRVVSSGRTRSAGNTLLRASVMPGIAASTVTRTRTTAVR